MMIHEEITQMIFSLQDDPDVQSVLEDPEIIEEIQSGNMEALRRDPMHGRKVPR
jgi:hypothetical protein